MVTRQNVQPVARGEHRGCAPSRQGVLRGGALGFLYAGRSWSAMASIAAVNCSPMLPPK